MAARGFRRRREIRRAPALHALTAGPEPDAGKLIRAAAATPSDGGQRLDGKSGMLCLCAAGEFRRRGFHRRRACQGDAFPDKRIGQILQRMVRGRDDRCASCP
jgi:hypothetical protein